MARRLVVNADDAGVDAARDAAILDAFDRGIVTSASVVANGRAVEGVAPGKAVRAGQAP